MATEVFTWLPRVAPVGEIKHRVLAAQFGDGYRQTAGDGINAKSQTWPLEFVGWLAEIQPIATFLDAHGGWRAFRWTPPLGAESLFEAATYTLSPLGGDRFTLNVTFTQAFRP